ncbi:uncharacterized protein J8A68_001853 [[Candida] subhashii]|uniref:Homeobox domain-containing protein n=1 Tax=[Candida] subhashii TaxID=561895 RepID=A0A8J5QQJ3_9ASCO|nr:uncharacterized protein J8A68_001853 [[Candida] subhashii]KAG7664628.1 hypothetical protein J8A68_001853 [[Candida] subhashii]
MKLLQHKVSTSNCVCNFSRSLHTTSTALKQQAIRTSDQPLALVSIPSPSSTTEITKSSKPIANGKKFWLPLVSERINPINKLDITIDDENNIKSNSPITLEQAWNYFFATKQSLQLPGNRKVEKVRRQWFSMTNLMREDIRSTYQELLQSGKDLWNKQHVDLKLILSENISVLTGVRFKFRDDGSCKAIVEEEVNLHHAEKYFNQVTGCGKDIGNNTRPSFESLCNEEKLAYRDTYLNLLSSGRDIYNGKIIPLTGAPAQNDDHPYIEPDPEEAIEIKKVKVSKDMVRAFYRKLKVHHYLPVAGTIHIADTAYSMAAHQFYTLSTEQRDYYKPIFLDWYSRVKNKSMSSSAKEGTRRSLNIPPNSGRVIARQANFGHAFRYFRYQALRKTNVDGRVASATLEWNKLSSEEKNCYRLVYQKILDLGYCMHNSRLIPIQEKESIEKKRRRNVPLTNAYLYYRLEKLHVIGQEGKEWKNLDESEKNACLEELNQLVHEGKGECSTPEIISFIVSIRSSLISQDEGIVPTRENVFIYYVLKLRRELLNTDLTVHAIRTIAKRKWDKMTLQDFDKLDREYRSIVPWSASQSTWEEEDPTMSPLSLPASPTFYGVATTPVGQIHPRENSYPIAGHHPPPGIGIMTHNSSGHDHSSSVGELDSPPTKRMTRKKFPEEITNILLKWLNDHLNNPYPNLFEKSQLTMATGLNKKQLDAWFYVARRKKNNRLKAQKKLNLV